MIIVKREFNNGLFHCQEIYSPRYQILEKTNKKLHNATFENPLVIAKSRKDDYIETKKPITKIKINKKEEKKTILTKKK